MHTVWRWLGIIWWVFPIVLVAGGYLVPALRLPVTSSANLERPICISGCLSHWCSARSGFCRLFARY